MPVQGHIQHAVAILWHAVAILWTACEAWIIWSFCCYPLRFLPSAGDRQTSMVIMAMVIMSPLAMDSFLRIAIWAHATQPQAWASWVHSWYLSSWHVSES